MAQITQTVCDGCGKVKGETNHWLVTLTGPNGKSFGAASKEDHLASSDNNTNFKDYCGQECITKAFQEWLNTQQLRVDLEKSVAQS